MHRVLITALMFGLATPALAGGNAANGKQVFTRCQMCHTEVKGGGNRIGPNLFGVVGRKAGTFAGYNYSAAMKNFGKVWSAQLLDTYLTRPNVTVPGTKMSFAGITNGGQRADVIAYLQSLK
jgi:cytochrome c